MASVQKWWFFQFCCLGNIGQVNFFYDILERKIAFLGYKNNKFKKSKNGHFPKRVKSWFVFKNGDFSNFFLGNIGQENVFYDIPERKDAFLGYKNKKFKKSKLAIFPKGLTNGLCPKMANFPTFFSRQYRPGKVLLWYSRT